MNNMRGGNEQCRRSMRHAWQFSQGLFTLSIRRRTDGRSFLISHDSSFPTTASRHAIETMKAGTEVYVRRLANASQHNGKKGTIIKTKNSPGEGRVAVRLDGGGILSVKVENLDVVAETATSKQAKATTTTSAAATAGNSASALPKERTLKRDNALLREFDGSPDPNALVLYYHFKDREYDCYNAPEYNNQMMRYYDHSLSVKLVIPRKIGPNDYYLVGLQYADEEKNMLCDVAFQCQRSFAGISMLMKKRCFACHSPRAVSCEGCLCACFCSEDCSLKSDVGKEHQKLCGRVEKSKIVVENECVQLL